LVTKADVCAPSVGPQRPRTAQDQFESPVPKRSSGLIGF
jgi:hypothetical protein